MRILPTGEAILNRDAARALRGDSFRIFPSDSLENPEELEGVPLEAAAHYFSIFHNCEEFGLPNGAGWTREQPWLLRFLLRMRYTARHVSAANK